MSILAICPSRGRSAAAIETLASFRATRRDPKSRIVFVVDADDPTRHAYPQDHTQVATRGGSLNNAIRGFVKDASSLGDATSVGFVGDDVRFRTDGWDLILDSWLTENIGIAWGDDGWDHPWPKEEKASHWWLSRPIVDAMGLVAPTQHFYTDDYWATLGWAVGCARYFPDVLIEHLHPMARKAQTDATYERARRFIAQDRAWWARWNVKHKAADIRRLRAIARPGASLRVFADWHHPALWEALSIVFEDRFGWSLYSPVGPQWKAHGWRLQNGTPGWTMDDYLAIPGSEPEYPDRQRKTVTVEEFEAQPWDIIIASVGIHQRPFAELAKRKGALYVHQIGDARRKHDPSTRGLVMASAAWRGADIVHHQEFDQRMFAYSPVMDSMAVASFMLRLDDTSGPYRWLSEAEGIRWSAVECAAMRGPGYLYPMSQVAGAMHAAGWVWHDKAGYRGATPGDGYGHVLFNAASIGRPLIGHASYYKGQMGEPLWEDGVTCIDLDRHSPEDALRRLRNITPREHEDMSVAIRGRFDELVDFDAEAERIREALHG